MKAFRIKSFLTSRNLCVVTCGFFHSTIRSPHHSGASFSHKSFEGPTKVCCPSALPASAWRDRPSDCALPRRSCHPPFGPDPRRSSTARVHSRPMEGFARLLKFATFLIGIT